MKAAVLKHIRERALLRAGDRAGVAVSGGADSVALLRVLLELRDELGIVLLVAHFHHGIRGPEADADHEFVRELARQHDLEFHGGEGDAPALAKERSMTLEEAARELRYGFLRQFAKEQRLQRVATGHTCDDQAETVLIKFIRGAGSRGLGGIFPQQPLGDSEVYLVRPLLSVRRKEVEQYLRGLGQRWRQDATNQDLHHTRNRVRSRLLPLLEQEFNPSIVQTLSHAANLARAEEEYWMGELTRLLPLVLLPGKPVRGGGRAVETTGCKSTGIDVGTLKRYPPALQRHVLRSAAEQAGIHLDFEHILAIEQLLYGDQGQSRSEKQIELPGGYIAKRTLRELRFEKHSKPQCRMFAYEVEVPGSTSIPELGTVVRTSLDNRPLRAEEYNQPQLISLNEDQLKLIVRPWRAGDRFRPAHTGSDKKLKELLQPLHIAQAERTIWPVITAGERIIWVRGLQSPPITICGAGERKLLRIDEVPAENQNQENLGD